MNLSKLNEPQRRAVLFGDGPLLILAGAGSGKTTTLAHRIAYLISARGVKPSEILGVTFTNKSARELKERVVTLVEKTSGKGAARGLILSTFHSFGVRVLRRFPKTANIDEHFTILDTNDQVDIVREILRHINIDDKLFDPKNLTFQIGQAKNKLIAPENAEAYFLEKFSGGGHATGSEGLKERMQGRGTPNRASSQSASRSSQKDVYLAIASVFPRYIEKLRSLNAVDFDDLIYLSSRVLEQDTEAKEAFSHRFRYILVDEYQDTNPAQFLLLKNLLVNHTNITVVGDDDQSIYAWRGADPKHILEFGNHFKEVELITLDENYRSTTTILDAANEVIVRNPNRHFKKLWSSKGEGEPIQSIVLPEDRAESEFVADEIENLAYTYREGIKAQQRPWKDFAILYRSNAQSRHFEEILRLRQIPFKTVGGYSFLDRKEVKDVLSYWRLIANDRDEASARRIINWPPRGIGKASVETIHAYGVEKGLPFYCALKQGLQDPLFCEDLGPKALKSATHFVSMLENLKQDLLNRPFDPAEHADWGRKTFDVIQVKDEILKESEDPKKGNSRYENVQELAHAFGQLKVEHETEESWKLNPETLNLSALKELISRLTLEANDELSDSKEKNVEKDEIALMTLHGSKGLEFPIVFLVGMEDGFLPHQRSIDEGVDLSEERRLCYVGITRAKDKLYLTRAQNRMKYGKLSPRNASRFLMDVPDRLLIKEGDHSNSGVPFSLTSGSGGIAGVGAQVGGNTTSANAPSAVFQAAQAAAKKKADDHEQSVRDFFAAMRNSLKPPSS